ncbi:response regulator transcription factor [Endozoicomonas sp. SM1973]|uniref:Response regulator transcription factor n=1 Tax=Spartinivicinus marinus TaxID=2994442 RepID=A0A853I6R9_9GAMM|nr:response regulator transcription factor [Spartinivicinus marinus]MCX4027317.1 response regulator transcription factor [Spartinivicinus marinus]NYZ68459.1 response regulator transcription factor [Spartinivicinus marinus]
MLTLLLYSPSEHVCLHWQRALADANYKLIATSSLQDALSNLRTIHESIYLLHERDLADPLTMIPELITQQPQAKVVVLEDEYDTKRAYTYFQAGVVGVCNAFMAAKQIPLLIAVVSQGQVWCGKPFMEAMVKSLAQQPNKKANTELLHKLSPREQEVALQVVEGLNNKDISNKMGVSERTIKAHLSNIFKKLNVKDRLQLALCLRQ